MGRFIAARDGRGTTAARDLGRAGGARPDRTASLTEGRRDARGAAAVLVRRCRSLAARLGAHRPARGHPQSRPRRHALHRGVRCPNTRSTTRSARTGRTYHAAVALPLGRAAARSTCRIASRAGSARRRRSRCPTTAAPWTSSSAAAGTVLERKALLSACCPRRRCASASCRTRTNERTAACKMDWIRLDAGPGTRPPDRMGRASSPALLVALVLAIRLLAGLGAACSALLRTAPWCIAALAGPAARSVADAPAAARRAPRAGALRRGRRSPSAAGGDARGALSAETLRILAALGLAAFLSAPPP